jgi:Cd2+/Zn2+-exporting ATPase
MELPVKSTISKSSKNSCGDESSCSCGTIDFFEEKPPLWKRRQLITGSVAGAFLLTGLALSFIAHLELISLVMFAAVVAVAGREIFRKAVKSISRFRLDMNCLMSITAIGAFFIGHGEEGAAVILLFFIAEALEEYAADNARKSIGELLHLAPETARVKRNGSEVELHTHEVAIGETIVIRPGDKIPLDGEVSTGHSFVNEAPITGESVPAEKLEGDMVYAGTLNEEGYLEITVSKKAQHTVLSRIVALIQEAERKKSKTEQFIDRFARIYTPAVIGLAFATFLIPTLVLGYSWNTWIYRALVLLVVSCPCALAISTPVAMVSAITSASRHGVLIKGATFLEELNKARVFVFDKTGTLTKGRLEVTDIIGFNNHSETDVLSIAASLEARAEHPIAKAIVKKAVSEKAPLKELSSFRALKGKGLKAEIDGTTYYAGAGNLFDDISIQIPGELSQFEAEGKTAIFISDHNSAIGVIALADRLRENARTVISDLKKLNIQTEMLTGDNSRVARRMAEKTGIDRYDAGLLPEDKVQVIEQLSNKYGHVVMVGDGVNDAPALAAAHVGIAMGTTGTDTAIETADIALMHDDLSRIDYLVHLGRKTMAVVRQNVAASIVIKGSLTVLAVMGYINLWVAVGVGDMGLSLAVIVNAMRLTRVKA